MKDESIHEAEHKVNYAPSFSLTMWTSESVCVVLDMLDKVGREGITLWIILAKGVAWSMAEQSITKLRNCCKFRTSVPVKCSKETNLK